MLSNEYSKYLFYRCNSFLQMRNLEILLIRQKKKKIKPQEIIRLATTNLNKTKFEKYGLKKKMFMFRNV